MYERAPGSRNHVLAFLFQLELFLIVTFLDFVDYFKYNFSVDIEFIDVFKLF